MNAIKYQVGRTTKKIPDSLSIRATQTCIVPMYLNPSNTVMSSEGLVREQILNTYLLYVLILQSSVLRQVASSISVKEG